MSVKYALVSIKDGKRRVKYIVLTKDVKGYSPQNAEDIPDKEFMIKWQDSFHSDDLSHDGHYPGEILIAGATKKEIAAKAKELKIKLPPNVVADINADEDQPMVSKSMGKPLRKQRNRSGHNEIEVQVKKRRMLSVIKEVQETSSDVEAPSTSADTKEPCQANTSPCKKKAVKQLFTSPDKIKVGETSPDKAVDFDVSSDDGSDDSSKDVDDATVLLDALKKEHAFCKIKIEELEKFKRKAVNDLKTYKTEMVKKRKTIYELKEELSNMKSQNLSLKKQLLKMPKDVTPLKSQSSALSFQSSPLCSSSPYSARSREKQESAKKKLLSEVEAESELDSTVPLTPLKETPKKTYQSEPIATFSPIQSNEVRTPKKNSRMTDGDDSDLLDTIAERVKEDLSGGKPLQEKGDKVYVGKGVFINSNLWKQSTRKRRKDSMFYKDCAAGVWGIDELSKRTAQRKMKGKNPCTPAKVDVINAMLMGKLMSRGMGKKEAQKEVETHANRWLTEKCYDSSRPPAKGKD